MTTPRARPRTRSQPLPAPVNEPEVLKEAPVWLYWLRIIGGVAFVVYLVLDVFKVLKA